MHRACHEIDKHQAYSGDVAAKKRPNVNHFMLIMTACKLKGCTPDSLIIVINSIVENFVSLGRLHSEA